MATPPLENLDTLLNIIMAFTFYQDLVIRYINQEFKMIYVKFNYDDANV